MKKVRLLAIANTISFLIHVLLSYLTQFKLVNARDVKEISDAHPTLFTPAPVTFAIWGVIYISLAAFCIYHLVMAFRHDKFHQANSDLQDIGGWFILNNLVTAGWLIVWTNNDILASLILIIIQLISLMAIHVLLNIYDTQRAITSKVFTQFPLSIYLAWITIATIANTSVYLVSVNWNGFNWGLTEIQWSIIIISVAVIISLLVVLMRKNAWYGLVIMWALYGIVLKRKSVNAAEYNDMIDFCYIGMGIITIACLFRLIRNNMNRSTRRNTFPEAHQPIK